MGWSGLNSGSTNIRGNRKTEVVSGKQTEVSVSGQFQFQSDLIHFSKVTKVTSDNNSE